MEIIANVGKNILGSNIVLLFTEIDEAEIVLLFFLEYIIVTTPQGPKILRVFFENTVYSKLPL